VSTVSASPIAGHVLAHLDGQIGSARRLLAHVLRQSGAIRRRDIDGVLATMTDIQGEMASRGRLESERTELLWRTGSMLGVPAESVTLSELTSLMDDAEADEALARSAELRGLLAEVEREHAINRALMRQEMSFLEHLTRMLGLAPEAGGYGPSGSYGTGGYGPGPGVRPAARSTFHVVDYEA
jgi:hypothetical protein